MHEKATNALKSDNETKKREKHKCVPDKQAWNSRSWTLDSGEQTKGKKVHTSERSNNVKNSSEMKAAVMPRVPTNIKQIPATQGSWVTFNSPLWRKDSIKTSAELNASFHARSKMFPTFKAGFVNDAIRTQVYSTRRKPIIPAYNALSDRYAQSYFQSPMVKSVMLGSGNSANLKSRSKTLNKLSVRRRCISTPNQFQRRQRENGFVNDAIITERRRTKYKDIIPPYDARQDRLCKAYFERADIRRLIDVTCAPHRNFFQCII